LNTSKPVKLGKTIVKMTTPIIIHIILYLSMINIHMYTPPVFVVVDIDIKPILYLYSVLLLLYKYFKIRKTISIIAVIGTHFFCAHLDI